MQTTSRSQKPQPWTERIVITKLDARRRQLRTAIELWFADGDPISIHTLAFAAYEIIHVISKKRNRTEGLIFDSRVIKDEYRKEWADFVKKEANFFKHSNKDPNATIEFLPDWSEFFMDFAIFGLEMGGEKSNDIESAFLIWIYFHRPNLLTEEGRAFVDRIPVDQVENIRSLSNPLFLEAFLKGHRRACDALP